MALLWGLINTLQILTYMPLLGYQMPSFLVVFFKMLSDFNMNFLGIDSLVEKYFEKFIHSFGSLTPNFHSSGFENSSILINIPDVIAILFIMVIILLLLYVMLKLCKGPKMNILIKKAF